jgi:hypothetical protein
MENSNELIINWYECPICGYISRNLEKVKKCASQGKKNLYQINQIIEFHFLGSKNYDLRKAWFKGEIKGVSFFKLNHNVSYMVLLTDSDLHPSLFGREMKVPEVRIRSIRGVHPSGPIELDKK